MDREEKLKSAVVVSTQMDELGAAETLPEAFGLILFKKR